MISFDKIPDEMRETGKIYAKTVAEYEFLDDMKKVLLSEYAGEKEAKSEAERSRLALADPRYRKHLETVQIARHESLEAKTKLEALSARFEWYRTKNANRRAEINM